MNTQNKVQLFLKEENFDAWYSMDQPWRQDAKKKKVIHRKISTMCLQLYGVLRVAEIVEM